MKTIILILVAGLGIAACGDDPSDTAEAASAEPTTCVQLGGGWTFTHSSDGSAVLPPGDGPPTLESGFATGGTEANLPVDELEASRVERVANGWTDTELAYAHAAVDTEDPLRAARFAARTNGDVDTLSEADLMDNLDKARRQLADAPTCP